MVLSREKIANIFVNFLIFKKRKNALFMIWLINTVYSILTNDMTYLQSDIN